MKAPATKALGRQPTTIPTADKKYKTEISMSVWLEEICSGLNQPATVITEGRKLMLKRSLEINHSIYPSSPYMSNQLWYRKANWINMNRPVATRRNAKLKETAGWKKKVCTAVDILRIMTD